MKNSRFFKQAELLLRVLPIVNREKVFALKGGTAINFFVREMPVSVFLIYVHPVSNLCFLVSAGMKGDREK